MPSSTSMIVLLSLVLLPLQGAFTSAQAVPRPLPRTWPPSRRPPRSTEPSEAGVKAAITHAVQKAARGALAMGFTWLHVQNAYVRPGYVGVQVVAMTRAPRRGARCGPRHRPRAVHSDAEPDRESRRTQDPALIANACVRCHPAILPGRSYARPTVVASKSRFLTYGGFERGTRLAMRH